MERFLNTDMKPDLMSPLDLAFVGDCVYELFVREALVSEANRPTGKLNAEKVKYVNANAQKAAADLIADKLTDEEMAIFKRGRNARVTHTPKNMSTASYHAATGFETLFGWLYLKGRLPRLRELFELIYNRQTESD